MKLVARFISLSIPLFQPTWFGHPSGVMMVGAETDHRADKWSVTKVLMSRSARRLMEGAVFVPSTMFPD